MQNFRAPNAFFLIVFYGFSNKNTYICTLNLSKKPNRVLRKRYISGLTMNSRKIHYLLHSGKNSNLKYYVNCYLREFVPAAFYRSRREQILRKLAIRPDREYILQRVNYYCKLTAESVFDKERWEQKAVAIQNQPMTNQSAYYHDAMEFAMYFDGSLKWILESGDREFVAPVPTVLKNRPIVDDNANSVLLKLDKNRHFLFVNDRKQWSYKKNATIYRGDLGPRKQNRTVFMNMFGNGQSEMVDAASTNVVEEHPEWHKEKMTIGEHLDYKFIMSLEGNDVASNLKWVMSSNSIAVTPRLTQETWFMEGQLVPNYHFIEVKEDFSDLEERLQYYIDHPGEAEAIIRHAHEYVNQFRDKERENLISLLVLKKYFEITNGRYS